MRIALIKTSSMGDVIHAMPVVTDIAAGVPGARIDWVVEESFADLPRLHPAVGDVIPVAVRRWRRTPWSPAVWSEVRAARARLRSAGYDLALDLQGLVKSALVARWTGAPVAGFARGCAREPLATLAYARRYSVAMDTHAIERLRLLAAAALGYALRGGPVFGLALPATAASWRPAQRYVVLLHATSRDEKLWPAARWSALAATLAATGRACVLPWGSERERAAARELVRAVPLSIVPPRLTLAQCAGLLAGADAVVGVDTGLTHLATALGVPTVALFAATPAWRFGPTWSARARSLGEDGQWPQVAEVVEALVALGALADDPGVGAAAPGAPGAPARGAGEGTRGAGPAGDA